MADRPKSRAEVSFHAGLFAIVLPVATLPLVWGLAIHNLRFARDDAAQRRWARRLVGLAIVDTLAAVALIAATALGMQDDLAVPARPARIGVVLEDRGEHPVVLDVAPGSPAEEAGIRAGDQVVRAGTEAIDARSELVELVAESGGQPVELELARGEERVVVTLTPRALSPPSVIRREGAQCSVEPVSPEGGAWQLVAYGLFLSIAGALWIAGRRRGVRQWTFWIPFVGVLLLTGVAGTFGLWVGCVAAGGAGLRAQATGLVISEIVLVAVVFTWLWIGRRDRPPFADERERWSVAKTYAAGALYAIAWMARVLMIATPLAWAAAKYGFGETSPDLEDLLGHVEDPWTAGLVFAAAVILAPLAEECLFRGLLLPHLGRAFGSFPAIYLSAVLFGALHVEHGVLLIGPMVLGAVLGWARLRSRGLVAPVLLHVSMNATATLASWLG